jgi:Ca2+-binding RTX toxin-like protein
VLRTESVCAPCPAADGSGIYFHGLTGVGKNDLTFVDHATGAVLPVGYTAIDGTAGDDSLIGSSSNEIISGREGADYLWGVDGSDILDGGAGDDFHTAGAGEDTFVFRLGDGADVIELFDVAVDRIDLQGVAEEDLSFWDDGSGTSISAPDGTSLWLIGVTGVTPDQYSFV